MSDLRSQLESNLGASYTIERELGAGGMARVFVAFERALGRRVVIKVLKPELAAEVSTKRFEREIKLAASLQQANIVPVLSAGETDGIPHYTMPFVEGLSLRERIDRGRLSLPEATSVLRDVARALAYAHERGVVHRDIKPENVLLSGDAAVVTDFGIAKAISSSRAQTSELTAHSAVTQLGTAVGTPAYMAPEQISGDPSIDHRADIYSFGCLAYELIAGRPPFEAPNVHGLFAAHLAEQPTSLFERNPDAPPALAAIVHRCLEKDPAQRPQAAREILRVLESALPTSGGFARLARRIPRRQRRIGAVLLLLLIGFAGWRTAVAVGAMRPAPTVVVIPFFNATGDTADDYLADGIADGLATALGKVDGIKVASRSLGHQYRGRRDVNARTVGPQLGVTHVLHGSLRRVGNRFRLSAQLTSASQDAEVWSDSYDRQVTDAFEVQDEITRLVATELRRRLGGSVDLPATASSGTSNPEAYDLYLRGRFQLQRRGAGVQRAIQLLGQAIAKDSSFARAHAAYALALELLPYFARVNADSIGKLAVPSANRALATDSTIAEAHTALAMAYQHRYQWQLAEQSYRRAIAAEPPDADAHIQYGRFLFYTRTVLEALPVFERARQLDPTSAVASGWVGHMLELSGRHTEAFVHLRRAMEIDSTIPPSLMMISQAHLQVGQRDSARFYAERLARVYPQWRPATAVLFAEQGDRERALATLREFGTRGGVDYPGAYAALGDSTRWFEMHERSEVRDIWPTYGSLSERHFDFMRGSPRFAAIVRSVGLDERIFTSPTGGRPR